MLLNDTRPILGWLPGETLFSWASRTYVLWGSSDPSVVSASLFGSNQAGHQHDLPSGLDAFANRTGGLLGSARDVATKRSLLAYHRRFISEDQETCVIGQMSGQSVAHLKYRMGLLTSRFRANHPLKACSDCIQEDIHRHGWAYWHMQHQYPGVWVCHMHGTLLQESLHKSTGVGRFQWWLPKRESLRIWPESVISTYSRRYRYVNQLAHTICWVIEKDSLGHLDPTILLSTYREALEQRGWLTRGGNLRLKTIAPDYLNYTSKLKFLPELRSLPSSVEEAETQIGRLLRPMRAGTHPLRHLLIIDWLFGGPKSFCQALFRVVDPSAENAEEEGTSAVLISKQATDDKRSAIIERLSTGACSVRSVAKDVGVDTQTAVLWATEAGFKVKRRPKKLNGEVKEAILCALRSGTEKSGIAEAFNISIPTVNRVLRSEPNLPEVWRLARQEKIRKAHRAVWRQMLKRYHMVGAKLMRAEAPAVYAWLYRNDRDWLEANKPASFNVPKIRQSSVRWDCRDRELMREVQGAGLALFQSGAERIYLWQLYQAIPELKAKLSVLDRLPLTLRTINYLLEWRRDYGIPELPID